MKVLLIPDKFKGSLSAQQVTAALKNGIQQFSKSIHFHEMTTSDGGEGFLEAIAANDSLELIEINTLDPLGRELKSSYCYDAKKHTAYIELAFTSGISLLSENEKNVLKTSTYGTGLQIKDAIAKGAQKIYVGLGGSATNDAGIGIATALGYQFLNSNKKVLHPIGENLALITYINVPNENDYDKVNIYAVNDVKNPLFGSDGAAFMYAKQKGADASAISILDNGLRNIHELVKKQLGIDAAFETGAGAAGGTAFGLCAFLNAELINGAEFVLNKNGIYDYLENNMVDLIITGEGMIDDQTLYGKLVSGVSSIAAKYNIPVIAVCGMEQLINSTKEDLGLTDIVEISDTSKSLKYNMQNASQLIEKSICQYFKNNF